MFNTRQNLWSLKFFDHALAPYKCSKEKKEIKKGILRLLKMLCYDCLKSYVMLWLSNPIQGIVWIKKLFAICNTSVHHNKHLFRWANEAYIQSWAGPGNKRILLDLVIRVVDIHSLIAFSDIVRFLSFSSLVRF